MIKKFGCYWFELNNNISYIAQLITFDSNDKPYNIIQIGFLHHSDILIISEKEDPLTYNALKEYLGKLEKENNDGA